MPRKRRELKRDLRRAGFNPRSGKGSHTVWTHPDVPFAVTPFGNEGDDAKAYQEKDVRAATAAAEQA